MRPLDHRERFDEAFSNSQNRVLPGVGHFVPYEAPASVVDALRELTTGESRLPR
jgi:pimeloyl-ACP methyl ester carboxylesterase